MNQLISIIVPVYNSEKYLKSCLDSIKNQTYKYTEVIIIDDGSSDLSPQICDDYAKENNNFTVYHKKNEGVSKARNDGINRAKGNYIIFIDSDDTISQDYIETLFKNILEYDADISMCNIIRVDENGEYIENFDIKRKNEKSEIKLLSKKEYISNILDYKYYYTYATNKLIKKDVIKNIRFREDIHYNEDGVFFLEISKNIKKAVFMFPIYKYFYVVNSSSANAQKFNDRYLTIIKSFEYMEKYFDIFNYDNKCYFAYRYITYSIEANYYLYNNKMKNKDLKKVIKKYYKYAVNNNNLTQSKKIKLILKILFPHLIMRIKYK